jgi:hypothetical protein
MPYTDEEVKQLYRDRAHLIALVANFYRAVGSYDDPAAPGWLVVYIQTPAGQLSWHIAPEDEDLFAGMHIQRSYPWDGHTTDEKHQRIRKLTGQELALED